MATKKQNKEVLEELNAIVEKLHEVTTKYNIDYVSMASVGSNKTRSSWGTYKLNPKSKHLDTIWKRAKKEVK